MTGPNDWQKAPGAKCPCRGSDDMCACQNVDAAHRLAHSSAASDGLREAWTEYAVQYGPNCRDCADEDGVCPQTGIGCGDRKKASAYIVDALLYGMSHGFIALLPAGVEGEGIDLPTYTMIEAGHEALADHTNRYFDGSEVIGAGAVAAIWKAMSDAAPVWTPTPDRARGRLEGLEEAAKCVDGIAQTAANEVRDYDSYGGPSLPGRAREAALNIVAVDIAAAIRALSVRGEG